MDFNFPKDSSRSPIALYRAYRGESKSKKTRDIIKAFVDQTNQSSLRKILISQKRSENMKMGKSFSHKIKKPMPRVGEEEQTSLVASAASLGASAQPSLQPAADQYKRVYTSAPSTSFISAGPRSTLHHQPPKSSPSSSAMDTNNVVQGGFHVKGEKMGSVLVEARSFIYSDIPKAVDMLKEGLERGGDALFDMDDVLVGGGSIEDPKQIASMVQYVRMVHDILVVVSKCPPPSLQMRRVTWIAPGGRLTMGLKTLENQLVGRMGGGETEKPKEGTGKRSLDSLEDQHASAHQEINPVDSTPPAKIPRRSSTQLSDFPETDIFDTIAMDQKEAVVADGEQVPPPTVKVKENTPTTEGPVSGSGSGESSESKADRDIQLLMKKASSFIDPFDVSTALYLLVTKA